MKNTLEDVKAFVKVKFGVDTEPKVDEFNRFKLLKKFCLENE